MTLKEKLYYLRISQSVLVSLILLLEFITIVGFSANYNDAPSHGANYYYWASLILSSLFLGHLTIRFQPRWRYGPYRDEMLFDGFFLSIWLSICLLNISPAFHGESLSCSNVTTGPALTRCHLFLSTLSFAWILVPTFIASLYISISRWNHRMTPFGQETVIIDEFKGQDQWDIEYFNQITDRYGMQVNTHDMGLVQLRVKKLIFTTNVNPLSWYSAITDPTLQAAFKRRLTTIFEWQTDKFVKI